jgi:hypothetical protein
MTQWYCPLPFRHAFVDSAGIGPCCNTVGAFNSTDNIPQYLESDKLKNLQQKFLNGEKPQECAYCFGQEQIQNKSMRLDALHDYNNEISPQTKIDFVHYSQSNICNFKCRSCGPQYSHGIAQEFKQHFELEQYQGHQKLKFVSVDSQNHDWIINNLSQIKRLLLTGGEPTFMPEVKRIFQIIKDTPSLNIQVMMTTNCSWTDDFWYQLIDSMPNLHITASVDAVGTAAELIRHGTNWPRVEHNLQWLAKHAHSLDINTVVSCLNITDMYPLMKFCHQLQIDSKLTNGGKQGDLGLRHQFSVCYDSPTMGIKHFPDIIKPRILTNLQKCLDLDLDHEQIRVIQGLIRTVSESKFNEQSWQRMKQYHTKLDQIRNENHVPLLGM